MCPICQAWASPQHETKQLIREAIVFHVEGMKQNGEAIPQPSAVTEYVSVPAS
jgi:predicted RNase H-like HicB family nuclease